MRQDPDTLWSQKVPVFLWMNVFRFCLGLSVSYTKAQPGYWVPFSGEVLCRSFYSLLLQISELQAGMGGAGCLLVPTCVPTHEVLPHSTQVSWDPSTLLHCEVALVVHKCNCTQSAKPKTEPEFLL